VIVFFLFIVVLLIGLTTAAVMGRIGGFLADPTSSQSFGGVPTGTLSTDYIARLHFDQALRGYRMDQVDEVIDALNARLLELQTQGAALPAAPADPALPADAALPAAGVSDDGTPDPQEP